MLTDEKINEAAARYPSSVFDTTLNRSNELFIRGWIIGVKSEVAALHHEPIWVSVTETKPPFDTYVLCHCRIYGYYIGRYERIPRSYWGEWNNGYEKGCLPPTDWMKLPPFNL